MKGGEQMDYEKYRERYRQYKVGFSFWLDKEKDADIIQFLNTATGRNTKTETIKEALRMLIKRRDKK
jgi:hypothetical protein